MKTLISVILAASAMLAADKAPVLPDADKVSVLNLTADLSQMESQRAQFIAQATQQMQQADQAIKTKRDAQAKLLESLAAKCGPKFSVSERGECVPAKPEAK